MGHVEYKILGPLEVRADGRVVDLGSDRQRRILAVLLLSPDRVVPVARLVEAAWDGEPPVTADRQIRNRVSTLRGILTPFGGFIDAEDAGYRLRLGSGWLDVVAFDELVARGRATADPVVLREALALWRGPAFGGQLLRREGSALDEKRVDAWEDCLALELEAGRRDGVADELRGLVAAHPLRERLVGLLMRLSERGEALDLFDRTAARLATELGIDPSPGLRRLRERIAAGAPGTDGVMPQQLPADVVGFTGRVADQDALDGLLSDAQTSRTVVISAIAGMAGVGKTGLAVHWAHRVRDKFPDGQLFVNLRGFSSATPTAPMDVLGGFLRVLGVPAEKVPADLDAAAALYRNVLTGRRVLVVLDNAADADQVRPLLPGGSGCLAIVTSRDSLAALAGARPLRLGVLGPDEAAALLARVLGPGRVDAEPQAVAELARLCAYLPLALRIAAANIGDAESVTDYVARLADGDLLGALAVDGDETAAVRAAFTLSYRRLPAPSRRMFRLLGLAPGPDIALPAAAALAGTDDSAARALVDRLVALHLVERSGDGRYGFHDLVRAYAIELAEADPDRDAAVHRFLDHYLQTADRALAVVGQHSKADLVPLDPLPGVRPVPLVGIEAATDWYVAERRVVAAAIARAADLGLDAYAWRLVDAMYPLFLRGLWRDLAAMAEMAVAAARRLDNRAAEAAAYLELGRCHRRLGDRDRALVALERCVQLATQAGYWMIVGRVHVQLTVHFFDTGDVERSIAHGWRLVEIGREHGLGPACEATGLNAVGWGLAHLDQLDEALVHCQRALTLFEESGQRVGQSNAWESIGIIRRRNGDHAGAVDAFRRAIDLARAVANLDGEAAAVRSLAEACESGGDVDAARQAWRQALALYDQMESPSADEVRARLRRLAAATR
jgi:DNA-binding SARP family transcriptional activator/tetratricopeptide (TPR) repeat protein